MNTEQSFELDQVVSLAPYDQTEPPWNQFGEGIVISKRQAHCQSGTLYTVRNLAGKQIEVDTGWIVAAPDTHC